MASSSRPLSPHLQVYKPQLTTTLSILHRITGVALSAGSALLVLWLLAAAGTRAQFETVQSLMSSWPGQLLLLGWTFALFYHLCNGIRHLAWDCGWGLDLKRTYATGWTVVAVSVLLTALAWYVAVRG
jgi:succinate dehydrogenase / fumarate reductase, cytochrome b subunit